MTDRASPSRSQEVTAGLAVLAVGIVCAFGGYLLARSPGYPPVPELCLGHVPHSCQQEDSGAYLWTSNPRVPVALSASFGLESTPSQDGEEISVAADLSKHQRLRWMLELFGAAMLRQGQPGQRSQPYLPAGESFRVVRLPYEFRGQTLPTVQVFEGTLTGPTRGYTAIRTSIYNSRPRVENSSAFQRPASAAASVGGLTVQRIISSNNAYLAAELPYIDVGSFGSIPGSSLRSNSVDLGTIAVSGRWFAPLKSLVSVSLSQVGHWQVLGASPAVSNTVLSDFTEIQWFDLRAVAANVGLENLAITSTDQERQFWAGIVLGVGGSAFIAAVQLLVLLPIRRGRRRGRIYRLP
jgi:hypothetical protein